MIGHDSTVFVVDSEQKTRRAVSSLCQTMGLRCLSHIAAVDFLREYDPESSGCVVVELMLPDISGLHSQHRLAQLSQPPMPVIFLTAHGNVRTAVQAMREGAIHFLEKPLLHDELREAISVDHKRRQARRQRNELRARTESLGEKELLVLERLVKGMTSLQISVAIGVSKRTVELRRSKLMAKLQVSSLTELEQLARDIWKVRRSSVGAEGVCNSDRGATAFASSDYSLAHYRTQT